MKLQQGDVIIKSSSIPNNAKKLKHLTLAEGEQTGHSHQIVSGLAFLLASKDKTYLKVLSDYAKLRHQEHHEIDVPKGEYEINIVREYDPFEDEIRQVRD